MKNKPVFIWIAISFVMLLIGWIWGQIEKGNTIAFYLYFLGWLSSLLAVGYNSTPSNSIYGKIAFAGVIIMVAGIAMKILHLTSANEAIIAGLFIIFATFGLMYIIGLKTSVQKPRI